MRRPDFSTGRRRSGPGGSDALLMVVAIAAVAASAYGTSGAWAERRALRLGVAEAQRESQELGSRVRVLEARGGRSLTAQAELTAQAPPSRVSADVAALLPRESRLQTLTIRYGRQPELELRVVSRTAAAYDAFLARLTESPRFEGVLPGPEVREGEIQASVRAVYRPEPFP